MKKSNRVVAGKTMVISADAHTMLSYALSNLKLVAAMEPVNIKRIRRVVAGCKTTLDQFVIQEIETPQILDREGGSKL